jgi:ABC-type ATPase involved in cell division
MKTSIKRSSKIERTPRVVQLEGMFDVPPNDRSELQWEIDLPIEQRAWNIGLIVGPSGSGKSTIAREMFPDAYVNGYTDWPARKSLIDAFPQALSIKQITQLLGSVGFSSPPSWLRSFSALSNGEQFRATLARALAENHDLCVFDEFTSVVDRVVGKIGSSAVAKTVRRRGQKFIAVTCHDDVTEWLNPDWIYNAAENRFQWRCLQRRPGIELSIGRVHHEVWRYFAPHHYLSSTLAHSAFCFCAFIEHRPVAFCAWLPFVGRSKSTQKIRRVHRAVCLPDYQGIGIGNALTERLAAMWKALDYRAIISSSHPAIIHGYRVSESWRMSQAPKRHARETTSRAQSSRAINRLTASFEYIGASLSRNEAEQQLTAWVEHSGSTATLGQTRREARWRENNEGGAIGVAGHEKGAPEDAPCVVCS